MMSSFLFEESQPSAQQLLTLTSLPELLTITLPFSKRGAVVFSTMVKSVVFQGFLKAIELYAESR